MPVRLHQLETTYSIQNDIYAHAASNAEAGRNCCKYGNHAGD